MSKTGQDGAAGFNEAYASLNAAQKDAVDSIEGPVMVIAGPGTGKTQILTLRIANILQKTDTAPENILALTFTESGARAMRERLRRYIGAEAYRVNINTFHSFADRLIRAYPEYYDRVIGGSAIDAIARYELIQNILDGGGYTLLRPVGAPAYYVGGIIGAIADLKKEYISPERFSALLSEEEEKLATIPKLHEKGAHKGKVRGEYQKAERALEKNRELLAVYQAYEASLRDARLYDFEDMIVETVRALEEREDFKRELQEQYHYLLADEHQDVNGSQNRILELLCDFHDSPNLFVVGDEKQAIYRFQGASLENFLYFEEKFPGTKTISLEENYRSGQTILDASHSLISVDEGPAKDLRIPLKANQPEGTVLAYSFSHEAVEDDFVVREIETLIENGVAKNEIAVILRRNREVEAMATLLRKRDIPVEASVETDIFSHPIFHALRALIEAAAAPEKEEALFSLLHMGFLGISAEDVLRIAQHRSFARPLASLMHDRALLEECGVKDPEAVLRVTALLARVREMEATAPVQRCIEELVRESGLLERVVADAPLAGEGLLRRVYDEAEAMVVAGRAKTLRDVKRQFDLMADFNIPFTAPEIIGTHDAIQVMTAHKSKGLEFEYVFLPHLVDSLWGAGARRQYFDLPIGTRVDESAFDALDDERRLFYVSLTRAKKRAVLLSAETNSAGRSLTQSRLLSEIDEAHVDTKDAAALEEAFSPADIFAHTGGEVQISPELLKTTFLERGLSVTALNNYLASPWNYFYRNVLRIPETQSLSMLFGTAMHGVMRRVSVAKAADGAVPDMSAVTSWLKAELERLPITDAEYATLHEKGLSALAVYLPEAGSSIAAKNKVEFSISVVLPTDDPELPEIPLKGVLDRIDLDEEGKALRVIDYKTGKPKTRNVIEGKTKSSNGDYKRQLVFYALLLELYGDERLHSREGVLSFLEPDGKGVVHEEAFSVTDEEIAELKAEILRVAREITSGSFLEEACDPETSDYCHFVALLRAES